MKIKKGLTLLLAAILSLSAAACDPDPSTAPSTAPSTNATTATNPPIQIQKDAYHMDHATGTAIGGRWQTSLRGPEGDGAVTYNQTYPGNYGRDYTDVNYYTYRQYLTSTAGMKWSPLTWETTSDAYILDYTTSGFYSFVPNEDLSGWTIVDEMAQGAPVDVTAQYVGQFGILPGQSARAWQIRLNPNACWDDGTPITADSHIYSYQQLLYGKMNNPRADSLYTGVFSIVGAGNYFRGDCDWADVGILKIDPYTLVFITEAPVEDPDFYVPYNLTRTHLVFQPLWENCKQYFDKNGKALDGDSSNAATITTTYGTSKETTMSYGPYLLTKFQPGKQIVLQRNRLWYGYSDGKHLGQYQTDEILCRVIADQKNALQEFLDGRLDSLTLAAGDMDQYGSSDRIRFTPETYTTKLTFNTDPQSLAKRNSQVLSNVNFRTALSLAIDRSAFASSHTAAALPGYGLISHMYLYDPYTGAGYRESDAAKNALVQLYGLRFGKKESYETLEEAYGAITGFDLEQARTLMQKAYEEVTASGLYDGQSPIRLRLSVFQNAAPYIQMTLDVNKALVAACQGTGFEGKVLLQMVADEDYYNTMKSGDTDMIFSTWGDSAYNPYGILYNCYCDAGLEANPNQMEYGFDASALQLSINLDGKTYTASLQDWARWCNSDPAVCITSGQTALPAFRSYNAYTRCAIYSDLEWAYLSQYVSVPLYHRNSATLLSRKGDFPTDTYLPLAEFGGIAFYHFSYSDQQWEAVCKDMTY